MFLLLALSSACNDAGYALVSISPIYGWVDGCNPVTLSGHGFSDEVSASVGGSDITGITYPEGKIDKGFVVYGTMPAGQHGYADVSLRSGGETSTLTKTAGYYYVECPGAGTMEAVSPAGALAAGVLVTVEGCGLDSGAVAARVVSADGLVQSADLPLVSMCGTATVSFTAPAMPDGEYYLELINVADGAILSGAPCPPPDSGDTGSSCTDQKLIYGGAE